MKTVMVRHAVCLIRFLLVRTAVVFLCMLPLELLVPALVSAEEGHCDQYLDAPAGHPYGYRIRGDRCEGVYVQEVRGTSLLVASLVESFEDYDLASGKDLSVQWTALGNGDTRLRVHSLRSRLYYRMDTVRSAGNTSYSWPTNVLAALNIPKRNIGVVGWTQYVVGDTKRRVYLPLRINQQRKPLRPGSYQLVLLPGRELTEVFLSLLGVGADGRPAAVIQDGEVLGYGYYPAERGITIPLTHLNAPGIYYLEIGATLQGGGVSSTELWFYHAGE